MTALPPGVRPVRLRAGIVAYVLRPETAICPQWWDGDRLVVRLLHGWWCRRCKQNTREHRAHGKWLKEAAMASLRETEEERA
jgi:hypothetical protein